MLSEEQITQIKQQIIQQINSTFPEDKKQFAIQQIESMNSEQLENFLDKNKLIKGGTSTEGAEEQCVFCSIVSGKIKSCKIDENEKAIAVLDINPISKGHSLIIPKNHADEIQKKVLALADKVSNKIKKKLKPKKVEIAKSKLFGHGIVNVIPVYKDENLDSERKSAKIEELEIVREELEKKTEKVSKPKTKKIKERLWLPKRIP